MSKNIFTGNVDDELGPQVIRVTPNNEPVNLISRAPTSGNSGQKPRPPPPPSGQMPKPKPEPITFNGPQILPINNNPDDMLKVDATKEPIMSITSIPEMEPMQHNEEHHSMEKERMERIVGDNEITIRISNEEANRVESENKIHNMIKKEQRYK